MKKWLSFLTLAILPFANAQASALPNVLAGLDNASNLEVMNDQQLSEVRGTGNLPNNFAYREYYYNWNNYGSHSDYRSYIYDGGATWTGGIDHGAGAWVGEVWVVSITGQQFIAEERVKHLTPIGGGYFAETGIASNAYWNRPWDGTYNIYY
jgi:hypothetical protein